MAIRGARAHINRLKALDGPLVALHVGRALFAAGQLIENEAALSITRGAVSGKNHVPSKPGEAPNADTHRLDRSIETTQITPLKVKVTANSGYAVPLEFDHSGNLNGERPFMRPARDKKKKPARTLVVKGLNAALRKSRSK
jgi:hypothetical protein